ncbi:cation diffusion facilitator family transporter [Corynebacterium sp. H128]|uniref:cation diffusion facilitator family transporter n=1 Tax=unclassified Corynebacterium TaxID=2624378 RepID=UPI0030A3E096
MPHNHDHSHHHESSNRTRLGIALAITGIILLAEIFGAWWTSSLALFADAGHMAVDTAGLAIAFTAASLILRPASSKHTWGLRRAEVISSALQALLLGSVGLYTIIEAVRRLITPVDVNSHGLLLIGIIGLLGNIASFIVLSGGEHNLNMKAATLEVLNDALGSVAVIISAIVVATTGFARADAIASLLIALLILPRAFHILRESGQILLESTPPGLDLEAVRTHILETEHVLDVHDLHASRISSGLPVLTAHITLEDSCFNDGHIPDILDKLQECVATHFDVAIEHSTFQFEPARHAEHERTRCDIH